MENKLKKFAKFVKKQRVEVDWPIGGFRVRGTYCIEERQEEFDDIVHVDAHDYDSDTAFPEDEFDRIVQEKVVDNLPSSHFDLHIEETELLH